MANKRISALPDEPTPGLTDRIALDGSTTRSTTVESLKTALLGSSSGLTIRPSGTDDTVVGEVVSWRGPSLAYNEILVTGDAADVTGSPEGLTYGLNAGMVIGGATASGAKIGFQGYLKVGSAMTAGQVNDMIANNSQAIVVATAGGTNTTLVGSSGGVWAGADQLFNFGGTNYTWQVGREIDVGIHAPGSAYGRIGLHIADQGDVQGSVVDDAISIASTAAGQGWRRGIRFSDVSGQNSMDTTGIIMEGAGTQTVGSIIDFPTWTITDYVYRTANAYLNGNGEHLALKATIVGPYSDALRVGNGTNPAFQVDASAASQATGVKVTGQASGGAVGLEAISSGANEGLFIDAKGSGVIGFGISSTGNILFGRNAVPSPDDGASLGTAANKWSDLFLASGSVINWDNSDVTITHSTNFLSFAGASNGYSFSGGVTVFGSLIAPSANDGAAIGSTSNQWSDLYLAEGGVINWDNGDATLTQSGNTVTLAGAVLAADLSSSTGLPISTGVSGLGSGVATFLTTPSSANLAAALTDETGTAGTLPFESSGSWTPAITFATPGNLAITYTTQYGFYHRIGKKVTVTFNIITATFTHTTASGDLSITGLPFTSQNASSDRWRGTLQFSGITKAGYTNFTVGAVTNATTMIIVGSGSGVTISLVGAADMPTGGAVILQGSITYTMA